MEIVTGLHWIKGRASNIYIWIDQAGLTMVDTGMPGDKSKISRYIKEIGHQPADISTIMVTHADYDHTGGAAYFQSVSGAVVIAGAQAARLLARGMAPDHLPSFLQNISNLFFRYTPVPQNTIKVVADSESVDEQALWKAFETPGHSPDHFSFYSPIYGVLFAGDAISTRGGTINTGRKFITGDKEWAKKSAGRLLKLTPAVFACGHGNPMIDHDGGDLMKLFWSLST